MRDNLNVKKLETAYKNKKKLFFIISAYKQIRRRRNKNRSNKITLKSML